MHKFLSFGISLALMSGVAAAQTPAPDAGAPAPGTPPLLQPAPGQPIGEPPGPRDDRGGAPSADRPDRAEERAERRRERHERRDERDRRGGPEGMGERDDDWDDRMGGGSTDMDRGGGPMHHPGMMGPGGMGGMMGMHHPGKGALFTFDRGRNRGSITIRCAEDDTTRECAEAVLPLLQAIMPNRGRDEDLGEAAPGPVQ